MDSAVACWTAEIWLTPEVAAERVVGFVTRLEHQASSFWVMEDVLDASGGVGSSVGTVCGGVERLNVGLGFGLAIWLAWFDGSGVSSSKPWVMPGLKDTSPSSFDSIKVTWYDSITLWVARW